MLIIDLLIKRIMTLFIKIGFDILILISININFMKQNIITLF